MARAVVLRYLGEGRGVVRVDHVCCMRPLSISFNGSASQDGYTALLEGTLLVYHGRDPQVVQDLGQAGPGRITFDVSLSRSCAPWFLFPEQWSE